MGPKGINILIVEDEKIIALNVEMMLKDLGYNVVGVADSGKKALNMAMKKKPDLMLIDITLKGKMDGIELAGKIQEKLDIPIVYLTGHSDEATVQRAKMSNANGYIVKPVQKGELYGAIEVALQKYEWYRWIKEEENRYRAIINNSQDAIIILDDRKTIKFVNPAAEKLFEKVANELIGTVFKYPISTNGPVDITIENGSTIEAEIITSPIEWEGSRASLVIIHDLTSQRNMLRELKDRERRFGAIAENSTDGIVLLSSENRITFWNRAMEEMTGVSRSIVKDSGFMRIMEQLTVEDISLKDLKREMNACTGVPISATICGISGDITHLLIRFTSFFTEKGEVKLIFFNNVTLLKNAQDKLLRELELERKISKINSAIFSSSHVTDDLPSVMEAISSAMGSDGTLFLSVGEGVYDTRIQWEKKESGIDFTSIEESRAFIDFLRKSKYDVDDCLSIMWKEAVSKYPAGKQFLKAGYGFSIITPIHDIEGNAIGAFVCMYREAIEFPAENVMMFRMVAENIEMAMAREHIRKERERENMLFATTMNGIDGYVIRLDKNGTVVYNNKTVEHYFGDLTGKKSSEICLKDIGKARLEALMQGNSISSIVKDKNGDFHYIDLSSRPLPDGDVVLLGTDRTEDYRIRTEAEKYSLMLEALSVTVPIGTFMADVEGNLTYANPNFMEMFGIFNYTNISLASLFARGHKRQIKKAMSEALNGKRASLNLKAIRSGTHFDALVQLTGTVIGDDAIIVGAVSDISEKMALMNTIEKERKRFKMLVSNAPVGYINFRADGTVILSNMAAEEIFNRKLEGKKLPNLLGKEIYHRIKAAVREEKPIEVTYGKKKAEKELLIYCSKMPGKRSEYLAAIQDISPLIDLKNKLAVQEYRYMALFNATKNIIIIAKPNSEIVMANPAAMSFFGEKLDGLHVPEGISLDAESHENNIYITEDGRYLEYSTINFKGNYENYTAIIGQDRTQEKEAEAHANDLRMTLEYVWDSWDKMVVLCDNDMGIIYANRQFKDAVSETVEEGTNFLAIEGLHIDIEAEYIDNYLERHKGETFIIQTLMQINDRTELIRWEVYRPEGLMGGQLGYVLIGSNTSRNRRENIQNVITKTVLSGNIMKSKEKMRYVQEVIANIYQSLGDIYRDEKWDELGPLFSQVIAELGGWATYEPGDNMIKHHIIKCPWGDEPKRNKIYCNICVGLLTRFTTRIKGKRWTTTLTETQARGDKICTFLCKAPPVSRGDAKR